MEQVLFLRRLRVCVGISGHARCANQQVDLTSWFANLVYKDLPNNELRQEGFSPMAHISQPSVLVDDHWWKKKGPSSQEPERNTPYSIKSQHVSLDLFPL